MKYDTKIQGIKAEVKDNILVIDSKQPLKTLSSAIYNGGLREANAILNIQVPEGLGSDANDVHWSPDDFLNQQVEQLNLPKDKTIALMTAAKMQNLAVCSEMCGGTAVTVFATAGKTVAVTAGEPTASRGGDLKKLGTINVILLVDGNLSDACMVETVKTMTEAKTVALRELDLRSQFSGDLATGTLTDSVAVGCTKRGEVIQFAGTFTLLGELIGKCVRMAVKSAMYKQEKLAPDRPLSDRLKERGYSTEFILSLAEDPKPISGTAAFARMQARVEMFLSDPKVAELVMAGLRLDEDASKHLFPSEKTVKLAKADFNSIIEGLLLQNYGVKPNNCQVAAGSYTKRILSAILKGAQSSG
jgi:adenosylcobinamide amidohydrolase